MYSVNSYQDIKDPSDLEDEQRYNSILSSLLEEFDPECGNYATFKQGCIREAQRIMKERAWEYEEEEDDQQFSLDNFDTGWLLKSRASTLENLPFCMFS